MISTIFTASVRPIKSMAREISRIWGFATVTTGGSGGWGAVGFGPEHPAKSIADTMNPFLGFMVMLGSGIPDWLLSGFCTRSDEKRGSIIRLFVSVQSDS
jgi:hypothetical protein